MEVKSAPLKRKGARRRKEVRGPGFRIGPNAPWLAAAIIVLVVCSSVAKLQQPARNAYEARIPFSAGWWLSPLERNAPARLPIVESDLRDIFLLAGSDNLWAVGAGGLILLSDNGGRNWEKQEIAADDSPAAVGSTPPVPARFGFATAAFATEKSSAEEKKVQQTQRQQANVQPADLPVSPPPVEDSLAATHLNAVFFIDQDNGWAVGNAGQILVTADGGTTWRRQDSGTTANLNNLIMGIDSQGLAVGDDYTILSTLTGGQNWTSEMQSVSGGIDYHAIRRIPASRQQQGSDSGNTYLVAGQGMMTIEIKGAGRAQQTQGGLSGLSIQSSQNTDSFLQRQAASIDNYYALDFPSNDTGWAVGSFGLIARSRDGGETWAAKDDTISDPLFAVDFVNDSTGWVAGWQGKLYKTDDAGASWQPQDTNTEETLRALAFQDEQRGWVVGHSGTLLATTDGGVTWFHQTNDQKTAGAYGQYPAPWYFLSLLLVGFLLVPALQKPKASPDDEELVRESVADLLISDRPLEMTDPDPLEFKPIALGLSRFLRNENTVPPLTVAITGKWGSGKSSLMNLVRADLRANRFQSVWFNAWHHQKEEHLLAALLENVKAQAMPRWYTWHNLMFRYRLFKLRFKRGWPLFVALFLAWSALFGFFIANPGALRQLGALLDTLKDRTLFNIFIEGGAIVALATTALGSLGLLWRGFRAFGLKPAKLMASMSGRFNVRDFTAQAGFRYKFEQEFREVTEALHPHNLVILIDDLDRCKPDNVLEVLEAVNFLIASGSCFIIMGLDLDRVERCVGLGFKDVAEELLVEHKRGDGNGQAESKDDAGRRRRAEFARQYLEKLINIEVPVPEPTPEQAEQLLIPQEATEQAVNPLAFLSPLAHPLRKAWPALLILTTLASGYWLGSNENLKLRLARIATPPEIIQTDEQTEAAGNPAQTRDLKREESGSATVGRFEPGETSEAFKWYPALLVAIVVIGVARRMVMKPDMVVKDSPEFQDALRVWQPFIYSRQNTPRSIKRFMNRIRYFAMRLPSQDSAAPVSMLTQLLLRLSLKPDKTSTQPKTTPDPIPEATLVALGALQNFNHKWLEDQRIWASIAGGQLKLEVNGYSKDEISRIQKTLAQALAEHESLFHSWPPTKVQVSELLRLSEGIRVS